MLKDIRVGIFITLNIIFRSSITQSFIDTYSSLNMSFSKKVYRLFIR